MKKLVLIFIPVLVFFVASAQSDMIKKVFRLLPANKIYDLTVATKDSMLQGKTYYPADNDSLQIQAYNYGSSDDVKDYLYVSLSFETGQRASGMIEIRSFKRLNGDNLVIVSQTGGVTEADYSQHDLSAFIYTKDKKLIRYEKKILPATDEKIFMKPGAPDSVKQIILKNSNITFDLGHERLMLSINSNYLSNNEAVGKWLKDESVYFDWINDRFVISKVKF